MPGATDIVDRVHRAVALLRSTEDTDARFVAGVIDDWLAGAPFDSALGLSTGWRDMLRHRARDDELRRIADRYFPELKGRALASALHLALHRYAACFPRDRRARRRPTGLNGALFDYLLVHEPLAFGTLRCVIR